MWYFECYYPPAIVYAITATDYTVQTLELKLKVSEFGQLCLHYYCAYNVSIAHIVLILVVLGFHYFQWLS